MPMRSGPRDHRLSSGSAIGVWSARPVHDRLHDRRRTRHPARSARPFPPHQARPLLAYSSCPAMALVQWRDIAWPSCSRPRRAMVNRVVSPAWAPGSASNVDDLRHAPAARTPVATELAEPPELWPGPRSWTARAAGICTVADQRQRAATGAARPVPGRIARPASRFQSCARGPPGGLKSLVRQRHVQVVQRDELDCRPSCS